MTHDPGGKVRLAVSEGRKPLPAPFSRERAGELFEYDRTTGILRWRTTGRGRRLDRIAGAKHVRGYLVVNIDGKMILVHRIIFLLLTGEWPVQVDHRDGDRSNNRSSNLRAAVNSQNAANRGCLPTSKSGIKGVRFDARRGHWTAIVVKNRRRKQMGGFPTADEAATAYAAMAKEVHGEFARHE